MSNISIDHIIQLYEDGHAGNEEALRELNECLRNDAGLREQLAAYLIDEELIVEELKICQIENIVKTDEIVDMVSPPASIKPSKTSSPVLKWFSSGVAAALVLGASMYWLLPILTSSSDNKGIVASSGDQIPEEGGSDWIAKYMHASPETHWKNEMAPGNVMGKGMYELLEGEALVLFSSDVELVVQSPARFEVMNDMHVVLHKGNLRAKVGKEGHGFVIDTPEMKIRDLGTEFGVSVATDKTTELHVFNGKVELYDDAAVAPVLALDGYAARWHNGVKQGTVLNDENQFPTYQLIAQKKWQASRELMLQDPSLIACFDFSSKNNELVNLTKSSIRNAKLHNPTWVSGRWKGTKALLFDDPGQWVEFDLPNFKTSFTMQTWVKVDHYPQALSTVLNSSRWAEERHHWQLTNKGELRIGVGGQNGYAITAERPVVETGKWTLLTITYEAKSKEVKYYINDVLATTTTNRYPTMRLGQCHMGAWVYNGRSTRQFKGKIDEFTIRQRCLDADEIAELYSLGNPEKSH